MRHTARREGNCDKAYVFEYFANNPECHDLLPCALGHKIRATQKSLATTSLFAKVNKRLLYTTTTQT